MIDQHTHLWLIPACLVVGAFLVGGAVAGYRRSSCAALQALAAAAAAVGVLLVAAAARRYWVAHEGLPLAVVRLWCVGVVAALSISTAGSQVGRWLAAHPRSGCRS